MANECSLEINPAFRLDKVENLIIELWQSSTNSEWRKANASLITLLKIAEHDFFDDLLFLIDIAGERQSMAHLKEMEILGVKL